MGSIVIVHPYWDFWEEAVPHDLRADREELLQRASAILGTVADVETATLIVEHSQIDEVFANADVHAVVILASMVAPPEIATAVVEKFPDLPVVIWSVSRQEKLSSDFSHSDITTTGATVGGPLVASVLARKRRPFSVVASTLENPRHIKDTVRNAVAAGQLKRATILRVGQEIAGYTSVVPAQSGWDQLPTSVTDITAEEFAELRREISPQRVDSQVQSYRDQFTVSSEVSSEALRGNASTELALRDVLLQRGCAAGAFNCHNEYSRSSADFGLAPCMALGQLTSDGFPFTCTGDVLTTIAMLTVQFLGFPTLYHEIEALDYESDEAIFANTGEYDSRFVPGSKLEIIANNWFESDIIPGITSEYTIPSGPATIVGYVLAPRPRYIVAEGVFTERKLPNTGTPNAAFRFNAGDVGRSWERWTQAGALHHSVATNAHLAARIIEIGRYTNSEVVEI